MAKKMRTINNPLDRQTRNDINYNFSTLESDLTGGLGDINEKLDAVLDGRQLEELFYAAEDARQEAESARNQSAYANEKGNYANEKGAYANKQGTYAKEQGDYAKEKAEYASAKTSEIEQAHTDLSQIKVEAVDATQNANTQADRAKQEADRAKPLVDKIESELPNIENLKHVGEWASGKAYKKNEEVLYNGSSYRAKRNNTGKTPSSNTADWQLVAQRGVDGKGAVGSVNGVMPGLDGDVPLTIGDLTTNNYMPPSALPHEYPLGITMFKTNNSNESDEWKEFIPNPAPGSRFLIVTYKVDERWQARQVITEVLGWNTGVTAIFGRVYVRGAMGNWESDNNSWSDLVQLLDDKVKSDSTTSNSSDTVATSKAVYDLQQQVNDLRNAIIELGGKI